MLEAGISAPPLLCSIKMREGLSVTMPESGFCSGGTPKQRLLVERFKDRARDRASEFEAADIVVLGASFDTVEEQKASQIKRTFHFYCCRTQNGPWGSCGGRAPDNDFAGCVGRAFN